MGFSALALVSPVLLYVYASFGASSVETAVRARQILVEFRIPHHALVSNWLNPIVLAQVMIVLAALVVVRRTKLFPIMLVSAFLAAILTVIQVILKSNALALLFPWRLSTWLVPLSLSVVAGWLINWAFERFPLERYSRWIMAGSLVAAIIFAIAGVIKFSTLWQEKHTADDRPMMAYVEANKKSGDVYLIPIDMQDFRLETGAPVYTEFKSIPYKDVEVLEWRRRVEFARKFYAQPRCKKISQWSEKEGFTYFVLPVDHEIVGCEQVEAVYRDDAYGVFVIREP